MNERTKKFSSHEIFSFFCIFPAKFELPGQFPITNLAHRRQSPPYPPPVAAFRPSFIYLFIHFSLTHHRHHTFALLVLLQLKSRPKICAWANHQQQQQKAKGRAVQFQMPPPPLRQPPAAAVLVVCCWDTWPRRAENGGHLSPQIIHVCLLMFEKITFWHLSSYYMTLSHE